MLVVGWVACFLLGGRGGGGGRREMFHAGFKDQQSQQTLGVFE